MAPTTISNYLKIKYSTQAEPSANLIYLMKITTIILKANLK